MADEAEDATCLCRDGGIETCGPVCACPCHDGDMVVDVTHPVIATPHSQALWILSGQGVPPTEAEDYADAERDIRRI